MPGAIIFLCEKRYDKDCYNLQLHISLLTLSRQSGNELDIVWPEKASLSIEDHDLK